MQVPQMFDKGSRRTLRDGLPGAVPAGSRRVGGDGPDPRGERRGRAAGMIVVGTAGSEKGKDLVKAQGAHYVLNRWEAGHLQGLASLICFSPESRQVYTAIFNLISS